MKSKQGHEQEKIPRKRNKQTNVLHGVGRRRGGTEEHTAKAKPVTRAREKKKGMSKQRNDKGGKSGDASRAHSSEGRRRRKRLEVWAERTGRRKKRGEGGNFSVFFFRSCGPRSRAGWTWGFS